MATKKPVPDSAASAPEADALAELESWFARNIPNSRFSQDVGIYNRIFNGVEGIKRALGDAPPAALADSSTPSAPVDTSITE